VGERTTNDGTKLIHRDSVGEGVPLVMVHGWSQSQELFRHRMTWLPSLPIANVANSHYPFLENPAAFNNLVDKFLTAQ